MSAEVTEWTQGVIRHHLLLSTTLKRQRTGLDNDVVYSLRDSNPLHRTTVICGRAAVLLKRPLGGLDRRSQLLFLRYLRQAGRGWDTWANPTAVWVFPRPRSQTN